MGKIKTAVASDLGNHPSMLQTGENESADRWTGRAHSTFLIAKMHNKNTFAFVTCKM